MTDIPGAIEAQQIFRRAFVIAAGDGEGFARQALIQCDIVMSALKELERAGLPTPPRPYSTGGLAVTKAILTTILSRSPATGEKP